MQYMNVAFFLLRLGLHTPQGAISRTVKMKSDLANFLGCCSRVPYHFCMIFCKYWMNYRITLFYWLALYTLEHKHIVIVTFIPRLISFVFQDGP